MAMGTFGSRFHNFGRSKDDIDECGSLFREGFWLPYMSMDIICDLGGFAARGQAWILDRLSWKLTGVQISLQS